MGEIKTADIDDFVADLKRPRVVNGLKGRRLTPADAHVWCRSAPPRRSCHWGCRFHRLSCRATSSQMSSSERNTQPGFKVALKGDRATLVGELDCHVDRPWAVVGGVMAETRIVFVQPSHDA